jgi:hypothetical protein
MQWQNTTADFWRILIDILLFYFVPIFLVLNYIFGVKETHSEASNIHLIPIGTLVRSPDFGNGRFRYCGQPDFQFQCDNHVTKYCDACCRPEESTEELLFSLWSVLRTLLGNG